MNPSRLLTVALWAAAPMAWGQVVDAPKAPQAWQQCVSEPSATLRLSCFDRWAASQRTSAPPDAGAVSATAALMPTPTSAPAPTPEQAPAQGASATPGLTPEPSDPDCRNRQGSALTRFWELNDNNDCGLFQLRGYRPLSLMLAGANRVNTAPTSPNPENNGEQQDYKRAETRIQLSVRTKLAQGLFTRNANTRDALWLGYTQQSYWQIFSPALSRPFRSTDHEPELMYILPLDLALPGGWRLRYGGISLNHQSNGQSLPLSRSWNRVMLLAGADIDQRYGLVAKLWQRVRERPEDDDNPGISNYIGRAEVAGAWQINADHALSLTLRHSLRSNGRGSYRLDWYRSLGESPANRSALRLHAQLFSGYGDSLLDYNFRRTVFSLGLSLVDW